MPSAPLGSRVLGGLRPPSPRKPWVAEGPTGGPIPRGPGAGRRPHPPHLQALVASLVAPAPACWRAWPFKPGARNFPAGLHHCAVASGGTARHPAWPCAARPAATPVFGHHPARGASLTLGGPLGTRAAPGRRGAGLSVAGVPQAQPVEGAAAATRSGRGGGLCPSLLPLAGRRLVVEGGDSGGRGEGAPCGGGHGRARKSGARDQGNCCGVAFDFFRGRPIVGVSGAGLPRRVPPPGLSGGRGCSRGRKARP